MFAAEAPLFTFAEVVPLAIFGFFAVAAWFGLEYMAAAKPRTLERLDEIKNPQKRRAAQADAVLKKPDTVSRVIEKTSALTKSLAPTNEADANKLKYHLASAGFRGDGLVPVFYDNGQSGMYVDTLGTTVTYPFIVRSVVEFPPGVNGNDPTTRYYNVVVGFNNALLRANGAGPTGIS